MVAQQESDNDYEQGGDGGVVRLVKSEAPQECT